jgi:hypothetical protein
MGRRRESDVLRGGIEKVTRIDPSADFQAAESVA